MTKEIEYSIDVICSNCGYKGIKKYPKGTQVPMRDFCPKCECTTLTRRWTE